MQHPSRSRERITKTNGSPAVQREYKHGFEFCLSSASGSVGFPPVVTVMRCSQLLEACPQNPIGECSCGFREFLRLLQQDQVSRTYVIVLRFTRNVNDHHARRRYLFLLPPLHTSTAKRFKVKPVPFVSWKSGQCEKAADISLTWFCATTRKRSFNARGELFNAFIIIGSVI